MYRKSAGLQICEQALFYHQVSTIGKPCFKNLQFLTFLALNRNGNLANEANYRYNCVMVFLQRFLGFFSQSLGCQLNELIFNTCTFRTVQVFLEVTLTLALYKFWWLIDWLIYLMIGDSCSVHLWRIHWDHRTNQEKHKGVQLEVQGFCCHGKPGREGTILKIYFNAPEKFLKSRKSCEDRTRKVM